MPILTEEDLTVLYQTKPVKNFHTKVVGITFRDPKVIETVEDGQFFVLLAELDNEHDSNAVAVRRQSDEAHVGYIGRDYGLNAEIQEAILRGDKFLAKATVTGRDKENLGINLQVLQFSGSDNILGCDSDPDGQ